MALTKTIEDDKFEIVGLYKHVHVRTATVIKEDGKELNRSFHRRVVQPGDIDKDNNYTKTDISSESTEIQGICNAVWTDVVHDAWKENFVAIKG